MKLQTKINDLTMLLASETATKTMRADADALNSAIATCIRERAIIALDKSIASREAETLAKAAFAKLPPARRALAETIKTEAEALGLLASKVGESYSGATKYRVRWAGRPSATTYTDKGDQYSRKCTYHKTDASHVVTLSADTAPLLVERADVAALSARDGLPLIGVFADGRAEWVRRKGKAIVSESGWISHFGATCYHSTKSADDAEKGLARKLSAIRKEWNDAQSARENAVKAAKEDRRARLVARLCNGAVATIDDARTLGYCTPGIEAFQARTGIGNSASLPELVRTGDHNAIRLALAVARKVSHN